MALSDNSFEYLVVRVRSVKFITYKSKITEVESEGLRTKD